MKEIIIDSKNEAQRIDKFLFRYLNNAPKSFVYKMLRKKNIKLNGKKASPEEILKKGDIIALFFKDETIENFRREIKPLPVCANVNIIYEDSDIIVAEKPKGLLTQASKKGDDCLNSRLLSYMQLKGELTETFTPSVCNRLDRNTRGLVTFGKTLKGSRELSLGFKEGFIKKYYLTLVSGIIENEADIIAYHKKSGLRSEILFDFQPDTVKTMTHIEPVKHNNSFTLLNIRLDTGKTHQIRAVLSAMGLPVVGDRKYGDKSINEYFKKEYGLENQFLLCYKVEIDPDGKKFFALKKAVYKLPCNNSEKNIIKSEFGLDL